MFKTMGDLSFKWLQYVRTHREWIKLKSWLEEDREVNIWKRGADFSTSLGTGEKLLTVIAYPWQGTLCWKEHKNLRKDKTKIKEK